MIFIEYLAATCCRAAKMGGGDAKFDLFKRFKKKILE